MYCFVCIGVLYLTILGSDYSENIRSYKHTKIKTHITIRRIKIRTKSLFNTALTLFHRDFGLLKYVKLSFKFILYDISRFHIINDFLKLHQKAECIVVSKTQLF